MRMTQLGKMIFVAICLGLLEAAWTTPTAPGATRAGLGCFAIGAVLAVVCWPRVWWLFGLSMVQEATQILVGQSSAWRPNWDWVFHHWSAGCFGVNLYPVILFPLLTIIGEVACRWTHREAAKATAMSGEIEGTRGPKD